MASLLDMNAVVYYLCVGRVTGIGLGDWKFRSQVIHFRDFSALIPYLHISGRFSSVVTKSSIGRCALFRREGVFIKIIGFFDGELDGLG